MNNVKPKHVPVLDSLRAIAALSVCFYHFICGPIGFIKNEFILDSFYLGAFGVQMFFVISGFIIPWSLYHNKYKILYYFKFLLKRFIRLEPPYLISILLVVVFFFLRKLYTDVPDVRLPFLDAKQIALHVGYLIPFTDYHWMNRVYWTLAIEFQFYLFMGLFYFLIIKDDFKIRLSGYLFVFGVSFIGSDQFLLHWLPVFLLGNLLFLKMTDHINKIEFYFFSIVSFLLISLYNPLPAFFACFISVVMILFFYNYSNKILNWFGKISYSIYLTHAIVGLASINVMLRFANSSFSKVLIIIIGFLITLFVSYIMYRFVEKKSQQISSKINFYNKND
ncbi:MAG: acyltransferase [Bacteroidetes bacterium]|nr:acyltransferase [Bacteroidota bacterium]